MMIFIIFASVGAVLFALLAFLLFFGLRRWYVLGAVFAVLSLFFVLVDIKTLQIHKMTSGGQGGMPPTTVTSAEVKQENWPPLLSAIGSVSAVQGATISSELPGTVAEVGFESGAVVKKGALLVRFDTSAEEAQLRSADADTELAKADLERARDLATRKVISKAELDTAESKFKQKTAMTENMRAIIAKKTMQAPFDGITGIRMVNIGQMVKAGDQIVPLQSLDPVYVDFALPQQRLADLSTGLEVNMHTDAFPGRVFRGTLTAINSAVDVATRNVTLQATFPNSDHKLRPGMFAKVDVVLPRKEAVLAIPATAIAYAPYGDSVFVIEKKKDEKTGKESQVIRQQFIRTGETRGDFVTVTQGLKAGDTVVSSGVFKLRNGMPVVINNELAPKPELSPTPAQT
jgi:membrane fusion protein (multidrug efflux system)